MMPKPKPETIKLNIITGVGRVQFNVITISQDVFIGNDGSVRLGKFFQTDFSFP